MTTIEIPETIEFEVRQHLRDKTLVNFKIFGHIVYQEDYPKYKNDTPALEIAVLDAKRRFAQRLSEVLRPEFHKI